MRYPYLRLLTVVALVLAGVYATESMRKEIESMQRKTTQDGGSE